MDFKQEFITEWLGISFMIVMIGTAIVYAMNTPTEDQDMGLMSMMLVGTLLGLIVSRNAALERQIKQLRLTKQVR